MIILISGQPPVGKRWVTRPYWTNIAQAYDARVFFNPEGEDLRKLVRNIAHDLPMVCSLSPKEAAQQEIETQDLVDFQHPKETVYVFGMDGADREWMINVLGYRPHFITLGFGLQPVFAHMAAATILYDRILKEELRR